MAKPEKRGRRWRIKIMRGGKRESATFDTKAEAKAWAADTRQTRGRESLDKALEKYADEVSPTKRGERWEVLRIGLFRRTLKFRFRPIAEIHPEHIAEWRDHRLTEVSPASVRREMTLLSSVWEAARLEWRWTAHNPLRDVRKPRPVKPRTRVISEPEIDALLVGFGYTGGAPVTISHRVALAFLFALETAMRAGEIAGIRAGQMHGSYVHLPETKNGHPRDVPLTAAAREILEYFPDGFGLVPAQIDALFRRARDKAALKIPGVADIHFHDTRRTATAMLAKKLDAMELAKVTGHTDLKTLLRVYYSISPDDVSKKLG